MGSENGRQEHPLTHRQYLSRSCKNFLLLLACAAFSGCAGLMFQMAPVGFQHPFFQMTFPDLLPNEAESAGVQLALKMPEAGGLRYKGNILLFARERNGEGIKFGFDILRLEKFEPAGGDGTFTHEIRHEIDKGGGQIHEKMIVAPDGAVKKFLKGEHRSKLGKFDVLEYRRPPLFPDHPVKMGDRWAYEEEITVKLRSFWIKQKRPSHKKILARSELKGFTTAGGRRVAVVYTEAEEQSSEEFSIMFKDIKMDVSTKIEEIIHFDYERGAVLRRLTNTLTQNTVPGLGISETGKSQSFFYLDELHEDGSCGEKPVEAGDGACA
ncbi:MAG: hypothetical protein HY587_08225 [Candidatus Omnitrophica bacterium]|nr:hypothetical protein [Candidatus Omnitrophota bacterium]